MGQQSGGQSQGTPAAILTPPSFDELSSTGPRHRAGRVTVRPLDHVEKILAKPSQTAHLLVDLGDARPKQILGVAAGTLAAVLDIEELSNLFQPQSEPLSSLDEAQAVGRVLVVLSVAGPSALGWGK